MFRSKDEAAGYLAAAIDGEGTVSGRLDRPDVVKQVVIINTDEGLLEACRVACDTLGVAYYQRTRTDKHENHLGHKPIHELVISRRDNLEHLLDVVTLRTPKGEKLKAMVAGFRRVPRPPLAELVTLYRELETQREMARHLGVSQATISMWMQDADLGLRQTGRPRGAKWSSEERAGRGKG